MTPYASGKEHLELRDFLKVQWMDKDPITNDHVWYAVTIVTRDGKENKDITPAKVCLELNKFSDICFELFVYR